MNIDGVVCSIVNEAWTSPFWYAVFGVGLEGTQYSKGRYAARNNPDMSYADIKLTFKMCNFHQ